MGMPQFTPVQNIGMGLPGQPGQTPLQFHAPELHGMQQGAPMLAVSDAAKSLKPTPSHVATQLPTPLSTPQPPHTTTVPSQHRCHIHSSHPVSVSRSQCSSGSSTERVSFPSPLSPAPSPPHLRELVPDLTPIADDVSCVSSAVPTEMVPQMVHRSSFHDETLCQLMDASRLNLLGDEAKKALKRAARARVVELKHLRQKTREIENDVVGTEPLNIKKRDGNRKRSGKYEADVGGAPVRDDQLKDRVEEILEAFLAKQEVDQAAKEHDCKDPKNHSRVCEDQLDKVEEELYRGRSASASHPAPQQQGQGNTHPPIYPPPPFIPGVQLYFHQYGSGAPFQGPMRPPPSPTEDWGTADDSGPVPNSRDLLAEILEQDYGGIPVKKILQDFINQQSGPNTAAIHSITSAPDAPSHRAVTPAAASTLPITPPKSREATPTPTRGVTPTASKAPSAGATPHTTPGHRSGSHPPSALAASYYAPSTQYAPSHHAPSHRALSEHAPSHHAPSHHVPSEHAPSQHAPSQAPSHHTPSHHSLPLSTGAADRAVAPSTSSDWVWGPEVKIKVQPPTAMPSTSSPHETLLANMSRAASVHGTDVMLDHTASFLPMDLDLDLDRDLPPLPPSTYAPSVVSRAQSAAPPPPRGSQPWELATHRLYSWALLWEDEYFERATAGIALGGPVDEFSLTILSMMMFKRILKLRLTQSPPQVCDKLFVPPNLSEAINKAVHAVSCEAYFSTNSYQKQYGAAQAILKGLWYDFGFTEPPRVIISLARHGVAKDVWLASRYDLRTHRFAAYIVCERMPDEKEWDGRPFMWWHAIRQAWPQFNIPDPVALSQIIKSIAVPKEMTGEISLRATSIARNLLLGIRPEIDHNISKLRNQAFEEVNNLMTRKLAGRLTVQ
jgi:hypothetical protein